MFEMFERKTESYKLKSDKFRIFEAKTETTMRIKKKNKQINKSGRDRHLLWHNSCEKRVQEEKNCSEKQYLYVMYVCTTPLTH